MALLAWLVFPAIALAICTGVGLLAERVARAQLEPALVPALGFAAAIAVLGPIALTGAGGWVLFGALALLAVAGVVAARRASALAARFRPGPGACAALAVYVLYLAPIALSGEVTFLGYNLLNDTAIHLAIVDSIDDHGARWVEQAPSSYGAAINDYVESRYPIGSHELLAALRVPTGLEADRVYQPFLAFSIALAAAALFALLRRTTPRRSLLIGLAAATAVAGQLLFSFALQGGIKELTFIACLAAAAALAAHGEVRLMALAAAALYGIYGIYALPWIAPLALVALWVVRPPLRAAWIAVAVFAVAVVALVPDSISYYRHGEDVIRAETELGPLAGPLKALQAAGIWLNGDYRFTPDRSWPTYALGLVVVGLAVVALARGVRRRSPLLLFIVPVLVAWAVTAPASSPYIDAKLLAVLSPGVLLAAAVTLLDLPRARVAAVGAVVLGGALLVSNALAYRMAVVAPADRLDELREVDERFAGRGPVLVNEYEEYTKHFMRRARGSDPYEGWSAGRAELRDPRLPVAARAYDLDQLTPEFVQRWRLIATRRSPLASRPPSNYERVWRGDYYEVWRRTGPGPALQSPMGRPPFEVAAPLDCRGVEHLESEDGRVVAAIRPQPRIVPVADAPLPPGWFADSAAGTLTTNKGGTVATTFQGSGPARVWIRGKAFRDLEVRIDGKRVGTARHLNGPNQWIEVGRVDLAAGQHRLELVRPTRSLGPGDAQSDVIGPVALAPEGPTRVLEGAELRKACGAPADWLERY